MQRIFLACMAFLLAANTWAGDTLLIAAGAGYRAERRYQGIDSVILAMDSYALWPAASQSQPQTQQ